MYIARCSYCHRFPAAVWSLVGLAIACTLLANLAAASGQAPRQIRIDFDARQAPVVFGAGKLRDALQAAGWTVGEQGPQAIRIEIAPDTSNDGEEDFRIVRDEPHGLTVRSGGARGAMYGALALAEDFRNGVAFQDVPQRVEKARFPFRAIKFNLPWMSYRKGESLQLHQETCRDLRFWEAFLDQMAENRFNVLSLWGLHPFTLMIRPKNFPEACGFDDRELAEWQQFWSTLFRMAKERGIDTYLVNWNIFVSPEFAKARGVAGYSSDWSYFGDGDTSELVKRYTRECVTQVIDEYEDLTGLGITHGERMGGMTPEDRQQWFVDTFVAGMKAAGRPARLIHRAPLSAGKGSGGSTSDSVERMTRASIEQMELPGPIWVEMKFNWSHAHSSPHLVHVHGGPLTDVYWNPLPENYRIVWMARNEDIFCLRWGEPDFIRRHIQLNGGPHVGGYFVGSECYIPAKDYFHKPAPDQDWTWAFQRQWFFYKAWGRLLYDPGVRNDVFAAEFRRRYGPDGDRVFRALALGSRMPLRLASLYKATWDFTLYAEGFLAPAGSGGAFDGRSPFISVDQLIAHPVLDPDYVSIRDYVAAVAAGRELPATAVTPLVLADALERDAREALRLVTDLAADGGSVRYPAVDAQAWAHLSLYFASKLRGAVELQTFRTGGNPEHRQRAVAHLEQAVDHWQALIDVTVPVYEEMPLIHLERTKESRFHWSRFLDEVKRDVEIARGSKG